MAINKLLERILSVGSVKSSHILAESPFFVAKDHIVTDLPILNVAFSGSVKGGLTTGLTILAGESKSFKTMLGLFCMKAYFDKYPNAIALFYDSEFGTPPGYLKSFGIDTKRIIHVPIEHVEQLKFDIVKRLESIERNDKVFILIDSLGNLASRKEVDDALDEKSVADMSRAKSIRSLLRIMSGHLVTKDLPCVIINHVYQTMEMFSKTVIPGGTAVTYTANQIFVITKSQEKDKSGDLAGYKFTINIHKSRFVKEKSKLPFIVNFKQGIEKRSGLFDLALESGYIKEVSKGWYSAGKIEKIRRADLESNNKFWDDILEDDGFDEFIMEKFQLRMDSNPVTEEIDE